MARKILAESKVKSPPVDLLQILSTHGIAYEEVEDFPDTVDALIVEDGPKIYAAVNARHTRIAGDFSLAHELGHYFHAPGRNARGPITIGQSPSDDLGAATKSPAEIEADLFAGELLVPLEMLKPHVQKGIPSCPSCSS